MYLTMDLLENLYLHFLLYIFSADISKNIVTYMHSYTQTHSHTCAHTHTYVHIHMHIHRHAHTYTCIVSAGYRKHRLRP